MRRPSEYLSLGFSFVGWLVASLALGSVAPAQTITLAREDRAGLEAITDANGTFCWHSGEQGQLVQQWFWYRIPPATDAPPTPDVTFLKANIDSNESLSVGKANPLEFHFFQYSDFDLSGSANGLSVVKDVSTDLPLPFHFYQYSDFDLGDAAASSKGSLLDTLGPAADLPNATGTAPCPGGGGGGYYWNVANTPTTYQNQLNQQWFWYRAEQAPLMLSISPGPNNTLLLNATTPARLQSTTTLNGPDTIWYDEGPISNTISITPLPSQPSVFYRLLPP
jgi:hypothetical protein